MEERLDVWINKKCYRLYSNNDVTWRLFYFADRARFAIPGAHTLNFWREKGVIEGEEESKNKGS